MKKSHVSNRPAGRARIAPWAGLAFVICLAALFVLAYLDIWPSHPVTDPPVPAKVAVVKPMDTPLPDFTQHTDVLAKKEAFIRYMKPLIVWQNAMIKENRARLQQLHTSVETTPLSGEASGWLVALAKKYRLSPFDPNESTHRKALLTRVDTIPLSLAMAQAANESAWGTSRFAREGNNMYGQWVYGKSDGMVPKNRDAGASHKVARYKTVSASIGSYLHNLNTLWAYEPLRTLRRDQRASGVEPDGQILAQGIGKYSSRGEDYIREIQQLIRLNQTLITRI